MAVHLPRAPPARVRLPRDGSQRTHPGRSPVGPGPLPADPLPAPVALRPLARCVRPRRDRRPAARAQRREQGRGHVRDPALRAASRSRAAPATDCGTPPRLVRPCRAPAAPRLPFLPPRPLPGERHCGRRRPHETHAAAVRLLPARAARERDQHDRRHGDAAPHRRRRPRRGCCAGSSCRATIPGRGSSSTGVGISPSTPRRSPMRRRISATRAGGTARPSSRSTSSCRSTRRRSSPSTSPSA